MTIAAVLGDNTIEVTGIGVGTDGLAGTLLNVFAPRINVPADLGVERIVGTAKGLSDLGEHLGEGLYEAEVDYLVRAEWARTPEDILWRRSKLGLHLSPAVQDRLSGWLRANGPGQTAADEQRRAALS